MITYEWDGKGVTFFIPVFDESAFLIALDTVNRPKRVISVEGYCICSRGSHMTTFDVATPYHEWLVRFAAILTLIGTSCNGFVLENINPFDIQY